MLQLEEELCLFLSRMQRAAEMQLYGGKARGGKRECVGALMFSEYTECSVEDEAIRLA